MNVKVTIPALPRVAVNVPTAFRVEAQKQPPFGNVVQYKGTRIYARAGYPQGVDGNVFDYWINSNTSEYYEKVDDCTWVFRGKFNNEDGFALGAMLLPVTSNGQTNFNIGAVPTGINWLTVNGIIYKTNYTIENVGGNIHLVWDNHIPLQTTFELYFWKEV